jgi:hypothetical protein
LFLFTIHISERIIGLKRIFYIDGDMYYSSWEILSMKEASVPQNLHCFNLRRNVSLNDRLKNLGNIARMDWRTLDLSVYH